MASAVDHAADVAAVVEALLALPLWRRRLASLAGHGLGDAHWARLCVLAWLHDIGKFNIGFQAKGRDDLGPKAGHVTEALSALYREVFSCLGELADWGDAVADLLVSAVCHHGRPTNVTMAEATWQASWWRPRAALDPSAGVSDLLNRCRAWFPSAFDGERRGLPDAPAFSHAFAGLRVGKVGHSHAMRREPDAPGSVSASQTPRTVCTQLPA